MLRIEIDTGNAAFAESNEAAELARILHLLAERIERNGAPMAGEPVALWDINGNRVGECRSFFGKKCDPARR